MLAGTDTRSAARGERREVSLRAADNNEGRGTEKGAKKEQTNKEFYTHVHPCYFFLF